MWLQVPPREDGTQQAIWKRHRDSCRAEAREQMPEAMPAAAGDEAERFARTAVPCLGPRTVALRPGGAEARYELVAAGLGNGWHFTAAARDARDDRWRLYDGIARAGGSLAAGTGRPIGSSAGAWGPDLSRQQLEQVMMLLYIRAPDAAAGAAAGGRAASADCACCACRAARSGAGGASGSRPAASAAAAAEGALLNVDKPLQEAILASLRR